MHVCSTRTSYNRVAGRYARAAVCGVYVYGMYGGMGGGGLGGTRGWREGLGHRSEGLPRRLADGCPPPVDLPASRRHGRK